MIRIGAFQSVSNQPNNYANVLYDIQPDGSAQRLTLAGPPARNVSLSGEARITHSIVDGPRLHVIHLSLRERDARHEFGGDDEIDLGPLPVGQIDHSPQPDFDFGPLSRDRVRQSTLGLAYDGRWKDVGELSFGLSHAWYRKTTDLPGVPAATTRSQPWLYNVTAAGNLASTVTAYAGYARGLEESGLAPPNAANRNQPLPAILTEQKDAGLRVALGKSIKAVVGVFDLRRPYFGSDAGNVFTQIGSVRSRGAEFSVSGSVTPRLDLVAGGMLLSPRVERDAAALVVIGDRPAGLPGHLLNLNVNWRTPLADGLSLDIGAIHRGSMPSTTDNLVSIPPRARLDLGGHYRFKLASHDATLRVQMINVLDELGLGYAGPGIYTGVPGRYVNGYLAVDI